MNEEEIVDKSMVNTFFKFKRSQANNKNCADCGRVSPIWAAVSYGFFICTECAAKHRELGVSISKVKSTILDKWKVSELRRMHVSGNTYSFKLGKESDTKLKYSNAKWLIREIDEKYKENVEAEPGVSFITNLEQKNRKTVEAKQIKEKPMPKFSDSLIFDEPEVINEVKNAKSLDKEEKKKKVDNSTVIKKDAFSGLKKNKAKDIKMQGNDSAANRLGFASIKKTNEN